MLGMGPVRQLACFLLQQFAGALALEIVGDALLDFLERRSSCRIDPGDLVDHIALRKTCQLWRGFLLGREYLVHEFGSWSDARKSFIPAHRIALDHLRAAL